MEKSKKIYLDNASATPIDSRVLSLMTKILKEDFANSSAIHDLGVKTKEKLEQARKQIAEILNTHSDEIIFTSGATESNNLAILGIINAIQKSYLVPHIITTNIEHSSVLETCKYLEKNKLAEITYVPVEENGIVDSKKIKKAFKQNTVLVSIMYANNEIGTIQPIQEIAKEIRYFNKVNSLGRSHMGEAKKILFHTDATQAINYLPIKVEKLGIDLMSFNGGKIYGPKGVGVLYVKRKTQIDKILFGGEQEFNLRAGTENVASIVGLAEALKITEKIKEKENKRLNELKNNFFKKLFDLQKQNKKFSRVLGSGSARPLENFDFVFAVNGDYEKRLPNNVNITISKIPSDLLVLEFSARGIYISEKSACKSEDKAGSYVIKAIRSKTKDKNLNSLRFSLGRQTTKADINYVVKALGQILQKLGKWYN